MLWRIVSTYEADAELRRDLHQEVLVAVWRALPKFAGRSSEKTYLARIAHNRAVSHVSREAARPRGVDDDPELPDTGEGPARMVEDGARAERLRAAIGRLSLAHRQVISLALEDMRPREIADVLGISANVVSIRLTRAKAALRTLLEESMP